MTLRAFRDWPTVLQHIRAGHPVWYHAPMDRYPVPVRATVRGRDAKTVRVYPPSTDADPFTADAKHLDRFRYRLSTYTLMDGETREYDQYAPDAQEGADDQTDR